VDVKEYRSKPIKAVLFDGSNGSDIVEWVRDAQGSTLGAPILSPSRIYISTPDGAQIGQIGDYIVQGVFGEFTAYPADQFTAKYDEIEAP
jgi:hypothetical protein